MDVEYSVVRGMNKYCIGWICLLSIIDEPVNEDKKQFLYSYGLRRLIASNWHKYTRRVQRLL